MRHPLPVTGSVTPQAPGRTPQRQPARRAPQRQPARLRRGLPARLRHGLPARLRHDVCPGAGDPASRWAFWRASGVTIRAARVRASGTVCPRASGTASREGGSEELTGGSHARR
jgi:hypothetical protein